MVVRGILGIRVGLVAWLAGAELLICVTAPNPVAASPQSEALTAEGGALMNAKRPRKAVDKFRAAMAADDNVPDPYFQTGLLLNRSRQWVAAFASLNLAASMGSKNPELLFEHARAMLNMGMPGRAITDLVAYDRRKPGNKKTSELIGKAFVRRGDFASAEAAFAETLKRDPAAAPMIALYRARIAVAQGDQEKAVNELNTLLRDYPQSPAGQAVRERMARMAPLRNRLPRAGCANKTLVGGWRAQLWRQQQCDRHW